ncbi:transcription antiterminator BglG [Enterococcus sp. JM4C]|uniref:BglG family transcription antiterminator LicT n=1 Tax=Candidatus Enterococcus huntleyi TaxID=1857217 RepID=UPI00137A9DB7|nr:PRD domain-containing protein [Enterococcus sp. JM4C]KAF1297579.1 transcription antiterminator BglG [Enterococcus sp. JM4C]
MLIEKIYNNNVVLSKNEAGDEIIFMGRGLAFQKKIGDSLEATKIEKEFILKDSSTMGQFQQLLADVPSEEIYLVKKIVDRAEEILGIELSPNIYVTLTDHIHYALQRAKENVLIPNPLLFEIKKFYGREFKIAKESLKMIEEQTGILFPEDEAGFIAFHFVNSEQAHGNMEVTMTATTMVRDILSIISRYFGLVFNDDSLNYQRIVTHLQFFAQRYLRDETHEEADAFLYELIQSKYPQAFKCVQRINDFLVQTQQKPIDKSEQVYLTIHIQRIAGENQHSTQS